MVAGVTGVTPSSASRRVFPKPKQAPGVQHQPGYSSPRTYLPDSVAVGSPRSPNVAQSPSSTARGHTRVTSGLTSATSYVGLGAQRLSRQSDYPTIGQVSPLSSLESGLRGRSLRRASPCSQQTTLLEGQLSPALSPGLPCRAENAHSALSSVAAAPRNYRSRRGTVGQSRAWTLKQLSQGASAAHSSSAAVQPLREVALPMPSSSPVVGFSAPPIPAPVTIPHQPRQTVPLDAAAQRSLSPRLLRPQESSSSSSSASLPQQRLLHHGYNVQVPVQYMRPGVFTPTALQSPPLTGRAVIPSPGIQTGRELSPQVGVFRQFSAPSLNRVLVSSPSQSVERSLSYHPHSMVHRMRSASPPGREASYDGSLSSLAQRVVVRSVAESASSPDFSKLQTSPGLQKAREMTHCVQRQASSPPAYPSSGGCSMRWASPMQSSPDPHLRAVQRQFSAPPLKSEYSKWILGQSTPQTAPGKASSSSEPQDCAVDELQCSKEVKFYDAQGQEVTSSPAARSIQPKVRSPPLPMAYNSSNIDLMADQTPQPAEKDSLPGLDSANVVPARLEFHTCGSMQNAQDASFIVGSYSVAGRHPPFPWTNQDEHVVLKLTDHLILAAVFDGHGPTGHLISSYVKQQFEQYAADLVVTQGFEPHEALLCLFRIAHEGLKGGERELAWHSGSTVAAVIMDAKSGLMTVAHAGDSRVLLLEDSGIAFETTDHVITAADEERILASGGEVREMTHCGITSRRIFVRGESHPGLGMARSLGDLEAESVGSLSDPEIHQDIPFGPSNTVVIATDGIWEKMSNFEVRVSLRESGQDLQQAVVSLVERASSHWAMQKDVDDITAVLIRMAVLDHDIGDTGGTAQSLDGMRRVVANPFGTGANSEISILDIPSAIGIIGSHISEESGSCISLSMHSSPEMKHKAAEVSSFMKNGMVASDSSVTAITETASLVRSIGEALGSSFSQPVPEELPSESSTLPVTPSESSATYVPLEIDTEAPLVSISRMQTFTFDNTQYGSPSAIDAEIARRRQTFTFDALDKGCNSSALHSSLDETDRQMGLQGCNSSALHSSLDETDRQMGLQEHTLAAVATAAMSQTQPTLEHGNPAVVEKQYREVDTNATVAPTSWRDLTPTGAVRSLLAPGPVLDEDGTVPVLAPFPSPMQMGAPPKLASGNGVPSLAAVAMANVSPCPSPLVHTSATPVPVPRKLEASGNSPQPGSNLSGSWDTAVDAAAVRSPSWSLNSKARQADCLSASRPVQQAPLEGVRPAPNPVDELQWRRWVSGTETPPKF